MQPYQTPSRLTRWWNSRPPSPLEGLSSAERIFIQNGKENPFTYPITVQIGADHCSSKGGRAVPTVTGA